MSYSALTRDWEGQTIFVIGGGDSLRGFDFDRLPPGYRLGCNASGLMPVAKCDGIVSMDHNFINSMKKELIAFPGDRFLIISPANDPGHGCDGEKVEGAFYLRRSRAEGLTDPPDMAGRNTGHGALNIAYSKGATRIILLGIDMGVGQQSHWHGGDHWDGPMADRLYKGWAEDFMATIDPLKRAGIMVMNASPTSRVEAFPKITLEEVCQLQ